MMHRDHPIFLDGNEVPASDLGTWRTYFVRATEVSIEPAGAMELRRQGPGSWTLSTAGWMGHAFLQADERTLELTVRDWKLGEQGWAAILDDLSRAAASLPLATLTAGSALDLDTRRGTRFVQYLLLRSLATELREALACIQARPHEQVAAIVEQVEPWLATSSSPGAVVHALSSGELVLGDGRGPFHGHYPRRWQNSRSLPSNDTPENRFVRRAVEHMLDLLGHFQDDAAARMLSTSLRRSLLHRPLRDAGRYRGYPRHSQVLLRTPGYRILRRAYFLLLGGAKVDWLGVEDTLRGGLRDGEWLYEAWVFLELQRRLGVAEPKLPVRATADGLHVDLARGVASRVQVPGGSLQYNRSFARGDGSYSLPVRPDFSLQWNDGALTVLDAKHRLGEAAGAKEEDLVKMHAYRDTLTPAGCRSAWVLYPGEHAVTHRLGADNFPATELPRFQQHLLQAGVGAIPFRPEENV